MRHLPEFPRPANAGLQAPLAVAPLPAAERADSELLPEVVIVSGLPR